MTQLQDDASASLDQRKQDLETAIDANVKARRSFQPSQQQLDFFGQVGREPRQSVVLQAVAGAGKTETLARAVMQIDTTTTVMMFNKAAAEEFKGRLKRLGVTTEDEKGRIQTRRGLVVGTCHSVGLSAWRKFDPKSADNVDERKVAKIIEGMMMTADVETINLIADAETFIKRTVSIAKQSLAGVKFSVDDIEVWLRMVLHYGLDNDLPEGADVARMVKIAQEIFTTSGKMCRSTSDKPGMIDYDDMIWAPIAYNCRFFQVMNVVIDEAQDTNPARQELAFRCLDPRGRLIACGDPRQAIYGFTGASSDALNRIEKKFNAKRMPLTVTYRCPKEVVKFANTWMPEMVAHDSAPDGEVRAALRDTTKARRPWEAMENLQPTDVIICRYNKPLVKMAFNLLKSGKACKMEGRDIGQNLIGMAKRFKVKTIDALETKIEAWRAKEVKKAQAKRSEVQEQSVHDRADCLLIFVERCKAKGATKVECVVAEIEELFADNVKGMLTLCSGHKSKGREWPRVFWMQTPDPQRELQAHEIEQENNIKGVIATRAQQSLILVPPEVK